VLSRFTLRSNCSEKIRSRLRLRQGTSALDVEAEDVIKSAFGANLTRLASIKKKYDPTNFFRVNQNISSA